MTENRRLISNYVYKKRRQDAERLVNFAPNCPPMTKDKLAQIEKLCPEGKDLLVAAEKFNDMLDGLPKQPMELYIEFLKEIDPKIGHHVIRVPVSLLRDMIEKYKAIAERLLELGEENEALREKRDADLDVAYRTGKEEGDRIGYDAGRKERP